MTNLVETSAWEEGIYQLETSDAVLGGPTGVSNTQAKQLANRTLYLKGRVDTADANMTAHEVAADPHPQYAHAADIGGLIDAAINKLDHKASALYATIGNVALSGLGTQAGGDWSSPLTAGDRVFVWQNTNGTENGLYIAAAGAWVRTTDADANVEVTPEMQVQVEKGSTHGDSVFLLTTDAPITVGTTVLTYEKAVGPAVTAGSYNELTVDRFGRVVAGTIAALPLAALPYPTIATSDNRLTVTPAAVAGTGGTVSIAAGLLAALAEEVVAGVTGRMRAWTTAAYTSASLTANTTYYLRAQISGGALLVYTTKGADSDAIPAGLKGTPNAANGGGFDSTQIDMLIAKIVTGANGTVPTVTALANAWRLSAGVSVGYGPTGSQVTVVTSLPLNWGRTPAAANVIFDCCDLTGHFEQVAIGRIFTYSRYTTSLAATYVPNGVTQLSWVTRGIIHL